VIPTCFLDTDILIEAARTKPDDPRKSSIAKRIVVEEAFGVSAQTIAEFVNASSRAKVALPLDAIDEWIEYLTMQPFTVLDANIVRRGVWLSRRYQIQYYDAALIAAAERLRCPVFYSEDLSHGQRYGDVEVLNPFL
jgi:predicted nucleic acid-binding protein